MVVTCGLTLLLAAGATTSFAGANDLLLSWAPNSEPDLDGYIVSYGTTPGSHPNVIDVGNVISYRVTGLTTGVTYYFVVQAYDTAQNVSLPSAERSGTPVAPTAPLLSLSATDAPDPVSAGSNITYTFGYSNTGNASATSVILTDTLPASTTFVSATGGGTLSAGTVTWSAGTLAAGASGSVQMVVRVNSPLANGTIITNGTYNIDSAQTTPVSGAAVTTTVTSAPVLTISKTDAPDPVNAGGNITYTIGYSNTGNMNASGVVITDALPANTSFVSATGGGTHTAGTVTWSIGPLNAGASGSVQMVARVNSPLANGSTITNASYAIDSVETSPVGGGAVTTTVTATPVLTISKTDSPDPVQSGGNITYTINYANTGNASASAVVLTDTIPVNTTFVSATGGGAESAGVVTWNVGTLAAGASGSAQLVVRVTSPLANGTIITNGTHGIDSAETSPVSGAAVTTTVSSVPVLTVSKTDAPDPVDAGANITYTINYANTGSADATGVVLSDTVPVNTTFVSATNGGTATGGVVTWAIGSLAAGASGSVQLVVRANSPLANGTVITNGTYSIDSTQTNIVTGAAVTTTVTAAPVLAVSATDAPDPVNPGSNITYTISYSNSGNANATGTVLTDTLPANTSYVSSTITPTVSGGVASWSLGTLNAGASGSLQLVVRVNSPLADGTIITNGTYSIDSTQTSPAAGAAVTTTVVSTPALGLTRTDSPDPVQAGANLTYTLSYTNTGTAAATGVILTDTVPANTSFVSATAGGTLSGGTVTWSAGTVNAGASGSVQMVVRITSPLANGTIITSGAASIDCDQTAPVSGAAITTTVASAPVLSVSAMDAPDPVDAGSNITYTVQYANTGNADATGVVLSDTLPASTTFVSASNGGTAAASIVTWAIGSLAAGVSGQAQLVVRVNSPLANGTIITNGTYSIDSAQTNPVSGAAVTTTVASSPVLAASMTGSPDPVNAGSNITYTISYSNAGNANATTTVLTDALPVNTTFVSATGGGVLSGGTVSWSLGTLNAGATGSQQLVVRVASPLPNGTPITNSGPVIDSAQTAPVTGAPLITTVSSVAALSLTLADAPDPVQAGANLTYTLSYANTGSTAASGVILTAAVPANTTFSSATGGGALSSGTVTWNTGSLGEGASGSVQMVVNVTSPLANGTLLSTGTATIDCNETAPVSAAVITTTVASAPVLAVAKTDSPDPVPAGANLTYTLSYANNGNANATGTVMVDTVPANTTFVSATNGGTLSGSTITWNLGTLAAGGSGSAQVVVRVASPLPSGTGITSGVYSIDSAQTSPVTGASISTSVVSSPVLSAQATDAPDPVQAGGNLTYTVNFSNSGNAVATGTVLSATLPANTTFVSAANGGVYGSGTVNWSLGNLGTGVNGSVQFVVRVAASLSNGTLITLGTYTLDSVQTPPAAGPAVTTTVSSIPILSLAIADTPDPVMSGADLTYTLSYGNTGNAPATGVAVRATVPAGTTFVSATAGATLSGNQVTWNPGTLNTGASGSTQLTVNVPASTTSGTVITASGWWINSNETSAYTAPTAATAVTEAAAPIVTSAVETETDSIYFVRGTAQTVQVTGASFLPGAVLNLSPDISAGTTTVSGTTMAAAGLTVSGSATLGTRILTLTNPDGRAGSLPDAIQVVKSPDTNGDCRIDGRDLNLIARAWNSTSAEPDYNALVDLDGDDYVGPDDLAIFIKYFALMLPGCP